MPGTSYYSLVSFVVGTPGETYTIPFPYLYKNNIALFINGTAADTSLITWNTDSTVTVSGTSVNDEIYFRRYTKRSTRLVDFQDGADLPDADLNLITKQLLYLIQEMWDFAVAGNDPNAPPGSNGDPDGDPGLPDLIDSIIDELLATQLFADLVTLIELTDINAEAIIHNTLNNHFNWSTGRYVDLVASNNTTGIFNLTETVDNGFTAINTSITVLQSVVDDNTALIAHIDQTYVDANEARAISIDEITTAFTNDLEGYLLISSYINGIESVTNANIAEISGIESYLVGTGDFLNPGVGSLGATVSGVQTTVNAHATQLETAAELRTALFSAFYPGGDPEDPDFQDQMVAAMQTTWETYADSQSATAVRVSELEANTQPIFIRQSPPDPESPEFDLMPYGTVGFPQHSIWWDTTNTSRLVRYWWHPFVTPPPGIISGDCFHFPPFGMWVPAIDQEVESQGARIETVESVVIDLDSALAEISTTLTAVVDDDIAAINQTLTTWVDPEEGLMYSSWNVRLNQWNAGIPVIAGVGLGLQQDPSNPEAGSRSDFIVMADYFSIVKPPNAEELLTGAWNSSTVTVPFIVNSGAVPGEPSVIINGDMFVRNTLSANDGLAGRFTFTQLDANGYPVDRDGSYNATGTRLVLASDTNNYNLGVGGSAFPGGETDFKILMWAGTGAMSHNNAVFYIDTDGNAYFGGQVSAANIDGSVGNVTPVSFHGTEVTVPNGSTAWFQVGADVVSYDPQVPRLRSGSATVSVAVYGDNENAARVRLSMSRESGYGTNVWGGWVVVSEYPIGMDIGTCLTLSGTHPTQGTGRFKIKVEIAREQSNSGAWQYPSSNRFDGTIILAS